MRRAHATMVETLAGHGIVGDTLVAPQRSVGVGLLVGVVRDPAWGLTLAVGLGEVWVEGLRDTSLRLLPEDAAEVHRMLGELRGARLHGATPAGLDRVAEVIVAIGDLAGRLESLEVNPLWVSCSQVEAMDALVGWR